ncbi:hypothetical protein FGO68_gene2018 [Halteria grandinella]|uniref:Uncharacterized protein n=1 Tax=Halteria grandinella TaxID=5974 RepID=A0A8J8NFI0_HALGN|nr:hypothetical protein FGO68_gene2018 [Halteria grandinella]
MLTTFVVSSLSSKFLKEMPPGIGLTTMRGALPSGLPILAERDSRFQLGSLELAAKDIFLYQLSTDIILLEQFDSQQLYTLQKDTPYILFRYYILSLLKHSSNDYDSATAISYCFISYHFQIQIFTPVA